MRFLVFVFALLMATGGYYAQKFANEAESAPMLAVAIVPAPTPTSIEIPAPPPDAYMKNYWPPVEDAQ